MTFFRQVPPLLLALAATACTASEPGHEPTEPECRTSAQCSGDKPLCSQQGACVSLPAGYPLGVSDGSPLSVYFVPVYQPERPLEATDLAFHPDRPNELWVIRREFDSSKPCDEKNKSAQGCSALEGTLAVVFDAGTPQVSWTTFKDPNAWHFMRRPPALAFGDGGTFATVGEARTANFLDDPVDYMGPTLWSADLSKFAVQPPGLNGSHLDMVHAAPFAMGIAHEQGHAYWVFNGHHGSLDRFDFMQDHGPGNEFHGDAAVKRYVTGQLARVPNIPSHMVLDKTTRQLYVADTGHGRIVKLGIDSGSPGAKLVPNYDELQTAHAVDGAALVEVVATGTLTAPSGIELYQGLLYVSDNATSRIYAFDLDGNLVRQLDTGMPPGTLAGLAFGSDDLLYFVDKPKAMVYRIERIL